jgi:hypothetical protein
LPYTHFTGTSKEEKIACFLPMLYLSNHGKLWLEQDKHFEEIYMYGLAPLILNKLELFNNLTNNNKNELTRKMLKNYFKNSDEGFKIIDKLEFEGPYTYDDINAINITNINEYKSIGQSFIKYYENFIVNPYNYENSLTKQSVDLITLNNYNMLFEYKISNTIYISVLVSQSHNVYWISIVRPL